MTGIIVARMALLNVVMMVLTAGPSGVSAVKFLADAPKKPTRQCHARALGLLAGMGKAQQASDPPGRLVDGYSRVACEVDIAPEAQRVHFKDHACGGEVKSCKLTTLPMQPRLCFDFCRKQPDAGFFGLQGDDCYCGKYFHAKSTGGQDECNFACSGNTKEMCGGSHKSSLFEMHMCADSADEATLATDAVTSAAQEVASAVEAAESTVAKLRALSTSWDLGVCTMGDEGKRVCALPAQWGSAADKVAEAAAKADHSASVLTKKGEALGEAMTAADQEMTAETASKMELGTKAARDAVADVKGAEAVLNMTVNGAAGPLGAEKAEDVTKVFTALGNASGAICALKQIAGDSFAATAEDDHSACARKCLGQSTGTKACVGFNYQYKDGLAACQFLEATGLVEPGDSLRLAVPIFEVSEGKLGALGISSMACYTHGSFTAGHPKGPLGTKVIEAIA